MTVNDLPALAGPKWLMEGWRIYRRAPLAWSLMAGGFLGIVILLAVLPLVGQILAAALQPVLAAGMCVAAAESAKGTVPPNTLFVAFKHPNRRDLVLVGLIESTLILIVTALIFQYVLGAVKLDGPLSPSDPKTMKLLADALVGKEWALYLGITAVALIKGALWFCVPLLAFSPSMRVSHAIRWSVYAMLSNPGAMILYSIAMLALAMVVSLPVVVFQPMMIVMLLVAVPVVLLSNFAGYKAVFEAPPVVANDTP